MKQVYKKQHKNVCEGIRRYERMCSVYEGVFIPCNPYIATCRSSRSTKLSRVDEDVDVGVWVCHSR